MIWPSQHRHLEACGKEMCIGTRKGGKQINSQIGTTYDKDMKVQLLSHLPTPTCSKEPVRIYKPWRDHIFHLPTKKMSCHETGSPPSPWGCHLASVADWNHVFCAASKFSKRKKDIEKWQANLVGGESPLKNISQNGKSSPNRGENKKYLKPPPRQANFWVFGTPWDSDE